MTGREYAALLREAADFFEAHPDLPVPDTYRSLAVLYEISLANSLSSWVTALAFFQERERLLQCCIRGIFGYPGQGHVEQVGLHFV
jgi:hypothetical protein